MKKSIVASVLLIIYIFGFIIVSTVSGANGNEVPDLISVPEPATLFLLGVGLVGLAGFGRKKFKK